MAGVSGRRGVDAWTDGQARDRTGRRAGRQGYRVKFGQGQERRIVEEEQSQGCSKEERLEESYRRVMPSPPFTSLS